MTGAGTVVEAECARMLHVIVSKGYRQREPLITKLPMLVCSGRIWIDNKQTFRLSKEDS